MPLYNVYEYRRCFQSGMALVDAHSPGEALLQVVSDPNLIEWTGSDQNDYVVDGHSVQTHEECIDTHASIVDERWMAVSRVGFVGTRDSEAEVPPCG